MVFNAGGNIVTGDGIRINNNLGTAIITTHNGLSIQNSGAATVGAYNAINIAAVSAHTISGQLSGLLMGNLSGGATNRSLAIGTSTSAAKSYHWAPFRFGDGSTPTHYLDIAAGTATIAPIKMTAADMITSPVSGCEEFDGSFFYLTPASGTRQAITTDRNVVTDGTDVLTYGGELLLAA